MIKLERSLLNPKATKTSSKFGLELCSARTQRKSQFHLLCSCHRTQRSASNRSTGCRAVITASPILASRHPVAGKLRAAETFFEFRSSFEGNNTHYIMLLMFILDISLQRGETFDQREKSQRRCVFVSDLIWRVEQWRVACAKPSSYRLVIFSSLFGGKMLKMHMEQLWVCVHMSSEYIKGRGLGWGCFSECMPARRTDPRQYGLSYWADNH